VSVRAPPRIHLAGRGVGRGEPRIGGCPNTGDATTGADEQRGGSQTHESQKQRIFDQVLALFISNEILQQRFHDGLYSP